MCFALTLEPGARQALSVVNNRRGAEMGLFASSPIALRVFSHSRAGHEVSQDRPRAGDFCLRLHFNLQAERSNRPSMRRTDSSGPSPDQVW